MLLLEKENTRDNNLFLLAEDKALTYQEVFHAGDNFFNNNEKELVMILCDKDINTIIYYVAALRNNKVPLLLDKNYKVTLIQHFIESYAPSYIFGSGAIDLNLKEYRAMGQTAAETKTIYQRVTPANYEISDELALLIPTSGSTGDPKSVRLSSNNIDSCTRAICEYLNFDQDRVAISSLPIHYSYGLSVLNNCIYQRAKYVISQRTLLDKSLWDDVQKFQVTDFSGVPFMMKLLRRIRLDESKIKTLKCVTQAGGYLPEADANHLQQMFAKHNVRYYTMYGQTEASPRISYLAPEFCQKKSGTVGVAISCGQVFINEGKDEVGTGELCYKGENVALGYAMTYKDLILGDQFKGCLITGDIAHIDQDGFITIIGRSKRFIKISGISANLDKIEKDLNECFSSVVVIGKDEKLLVLTETEDSRQIKEFFQQTYNFNNTNIKVKNIKKIPLNSSGKTDYHLLNNSYC